MIEKESVSGITSTNAILEAQISPHSGHGADYQFQLVTDPEEYASEMLCPNLVEDVILCIGPVAEGVLPVNYAWEEALQVSLDLSSIGVSLKPGTTYHYRVLAARSALTEDTTVWEEPTVFGPDQTFTTPETPSVPTIEKESVSGITSTNAILKAQVSPPEDVGAYLQFQLFTNSREFDINPEISCPEPSGIGPLCIGIFHAWKRPLPIRYVFEKATPVSLDLSKIGVTLKPDTTYFYRALAARAVPSEGTIEWEEPPIVYGAKRYFTTPEEVPAFPLTVSKTGTGTGTVTSSPDGIECGAACVAPFNEGETVALTGTPAPGSKKVVWPGCPSVSESNKCRVTMESAKEVTALFCLEGQSEEECLAPPAAGPPLTLKIEEGEGTVVSNPAGLLCTGATGHKCTTEEIAEGSVVLTASPAAGYLFKGWKGCNSVSGRQCTVSLTKAKTVGVKFTPSKNLTINVSGSGKVAANPGGATCSPSCASITAAYKKGAAVTLATTPSRHFHFVGWSGDCPGSCTMSEDREATASFAEDPKETLSLAVEGGGQAQIKTKPAGIDCGYTCPQAKASFYKGEAITLSWKLNKGTTSLDWGTGSGTCKGESKALEGSCAVEMDEAHSLLASFE